MTRNLPRLDFGEESAKCAAFAATILRHYFSATLLTSRCIPQIRPVGRPTLFSPNIPHLRYNRRPLTQAEFPPSRLRGSQPRGSQHKDVAMLVIISDLHINDGTAGQPLAAGHDGPALPNACAIWPGGPPGGPTAAISPIDRIDLVLLGDVLDIIGSRALAGLAVPALGRPSIAGRHRDGHRHRRGNSPPQRRSHPHAAVLGDRGHGQPAAGHRGRPAGAGSRGNARRRLHALHGRQSRLAAAPVRHSSTT